MCGAPGQAKEAAAKEKASAAGHTYDYFRDKWDKFDVDAALEDVDKVRVDGPQAPSKALASQTPRCYSVGVCWKQCSR